MKKKNPELQDRLHSTDKGLEVRVFVLPRSSESKIIGIHDGSLKIKLTKPPIDGQANAACCQLVAKRLGVPKSQVMVTRGHASRQKTLFVKGVSEKQLKQRLYNEFKKINSKE